MAFPMHMWEKYEYIEKLRQMKVAAALPGPDRADHRARTGF
jgi:hypothetical protein